MSEHFAAVTVSAYLHICIHNIFRVEERRGTLIHYKEVLLKALNYVWNTFIPSAVTYRCFYAFSFFLMSVNNMKST